jgi:hypothetical protein
MLGAAGVKDGGAFGTRVVCGQVFVDRKLMSARAAQDRFPIEFRSRPNVRLVAGDLSVTVETRIPTAAAFELDRDNIQRRMPMPALSLRIDLDSVYFASVDNSHE